jgi:two-component system sensor histidine kinase KdpD
VTTRKRNSPIRYTLAAALVACLTILCYSLRPLISETDVIMVFLVGAVVSAVWTGRGPAILYSFLSVSAFNFFFIEPRFEFNVYNTSYWLTFTVMFFACVVISTLAARLKDQVYLAERRERETRILYELLKDLNAAREKDEMALSLLLHVKGVLQSKARIRFPEKYLGDRLSHVSLALPMKSYGTLEIETGQDLPEDQRRVLETCIALFFSVMEGVAKAQQAEQAKIQAETEKTRSILLSAMSHDLRSPLAAISGSAETLLQKYSGEPLLSSIRQEAGRLTRIVSNLLDITRMETGNIKLNMMAYDPSEIIGSAVAACRETLKQHRLALHVEKGLPFVRMDGLLVSQLMQNLLENAARHTPAGSIIDFNAYMREGSFCFVVSDNGPGIPAGSEMNIFNKFVSLSPEGKPKGAGLGLAICQSIVAAHQGRILAQNKPEGGARFVVELPPSLTLAETREAANA